MLLKILGLLAQGANIYSYMLNSYYIYDKKLWNDD